VIIGPHLPPKDTRRTCERFYSWCGIGLSGAVEEGKDSFPIYAISLSSVHG